MDDNGLQHFSLSDPKCIRAKVKATCPLIRGQGAKDGELRESVKSTRLFADLNLQLLLRTWTQKAKGQTTAAETRVGGPWNFYACCCYKVFSLIFFAPRPPPAAADSNRDEIKKKREQFSPLCFSFFPSTPLGDALLFFLFMIHFRSCSLQHQMLRGERGF